MDGVTASVSQCMYGECEPQLKCCRTLDLSGKATEEKTAVTELKRSPSSSSITSPFSLVTPSLSCAACSIPGLEGANTGRDQNMLQKNELKQTQSGVDNITNSLHAS